MTPATLAALIQARQNRQALAFAKNLQSGAEYVLPDPTAPAALNEAGAAALAADKTGTHIIGNQSWFIEARNPSPRLILVGAVHIAQALAPLATLSGFEVVLADPRTGYATPERFPGVTMLNLWPDEAMAQLKPDSGCAVVTLTHDPKLDDPALDLALRSPVFYIGALGSRKTHAARLERLGGIGHDTTALSRIHGPVGLNIGAVTAGEIAVSIIAEIIGYRRGAKAR